MRCFLFFAACLLVLTSCKKTREEKIAKKWLAVSLENPDLDKQVAESRIFFDTVGRSTDPETNEQLYGARNMDSMRLILKQQLDSFLAMQAYTVKNTWLDFDKKGTVVANFGTEPDTVKWYFDEEGNLMLDEQDPKVGGGKIKMELVKLEDTVLQLRYSENGFSSLATFHPAQ
jgi:hypothetical protein